MDEETHANLVRDKIDTERAKLKVEMARLVEKLKQAAIDKELQLIPDVTKEIEHLKMVTT